MSKMKKTKKLIAATMALMMCIGSMPAYVERDGKTVYADDTTVLRGSTTAYGGELYPEGMKAEDYEEFGFSMASPDAFNPNDKSNPLEGYSEVEISELLISKMNGRDDEHWEGQFKVLENIIKKPSASAFDINTMDDRLVGNPFSYSENYPSSNKNIRPQTMNSIAVDLNGDGIDEIFETTLYVDYNFRYEPYEISMVDTKVYQKNPYTGYYWQELYKMTSALSSEYSDDPTFVADIEANTSKAYTALAVGDYDSDGLEEVAAYIPSQNGGCPFIQLYDYKGTTYGGSLGILGFIELSDLNKDGNKFNYEYEDELMPIVSLGTTSISGQDDLVVTVTNPRTEKGDVNDNGQDTVMAMYHSNGYKLSRTMEPTVLKYQVQGKTERMRFCSVTDADINGNGVQELLVGGYLNNNIDGSNDIGDISDDDNLIQAFCWNDITNAYEVVWSEGPKKVPANSELSINEDMMEPAAFTAARLDADYLTEKVFLEGVIIGFEGALSTGISEKERLKPGNFNRGQAVITDMEGDNDAFISEAYAATYTDQSLSAEQIVISQGDYVSTDNDTIYYDICWAWQDGTEIVSKVTNNDYIKADEDDNGTFLSIAPINCDDDSIYYVYKGKEYGWSEPELFAVLQSPPYWSELDYGAGAYSAGSIVYTVTTGWGDSSQGNWGIGAQAFMSVGIEAGVSVGICGVQAGAGVSVDAMAEYVGNYAKSCTETDSFSITLTPGNDYAIAIAVPMVTYNYDMWVPEYKVTQEHIDTYNELRNEDPTMEPYPYKVGTVVPGHMEPYAVHNTLAPTYTHMTVDEYNELAEKYGLDIIDKSILGEKTIGDPTTYPKNESEVVKAEGAEDFYVSSNSAYIGVESGSPTKGLTYAIEYGEELGHGFQLAFNAGVYGSATASKKGIWKVDLHAEAGGGLHLEGGGMWVSSSSEGTSIEGNMAGIPDYAGSSYSYIAQMYTYHVDCDGDNDDIYVAGFIIPDGDEATAPPSIPNDLRVVGTTAHEAVLKWSPSDYRKAGYYEIYVRDENNNEDVLIEPGTKDNYYVVKNLEPGTKYQFAIKTYTADAAVGVKSAISRYVTATTKSISDAAPYFTKQPENVIIAKEDYGKTFVLDSKAELGTGMEDKGFALTYQWQKCDYKELTKNGTWTDIEGAESPTYTLPVVTKDNADSFKDEEFYRVKVTQKNSGNEQIIYSKIATVYVEKENDAHDYYYTNTSLNVENTENIYPVNDLKNTYYAENGTDLTLDINVTAENSNKLIKSGDVTVVYNEINDKYNRKLVNGTLNNGYVNVKLKDLPAGDYEIMAIYAGGLDGSDDNKSYYLASQSENIIIYAVDTYTVNYHLNGGINNNENPEKITSKSEKVELAAPSREGYEFDGWYTDEGLTNPLTDGTIGVSELVGDTIDVYAKWIPKEYSITYMLNGGTNNQDNPTSYNSDMATVELYVPTKKGYSFEGWYEEADFSGSKVKAISGTEHRDIILYAKWEETEAPFSSDAEGNYLISTYEDLTALAEKVLIDPDKYAGASFVQTQNINAYEMEWNFEIGTEESPFEGIYDGGGYYILGLRPSEDVGGLFGVIGENGVVKNTAVVDFDYSDTADVASGFARVNKGTIDGCGSGINVTTAATTIINGESVTVASLNSDVKGNTASGMVGINEGTIRNCYSNAVVTGEIAAGIAAENIGTIYNVYNTGKISGEKSAGGIVGENSGSIRFGYNAEMISGESAGAIAGTSVNTDIKDMWYQNDMSKACGNKSDSELAVTSVEKADMRNVAFEEILNDTIAAEGGTLKLRTWVYSGRKNGGYPTISQEYVQMRTLTNEVSGISVRGLIHNKAQLQIVKLSETDEEYIALKNAIQKGELEGCWKIALKYPDGNYSLWDDELMLSIKHKALEKYKEYSIVHLDESNMCRTLGTTIQGENLVVETDELGEFGVIGVVKSDKDSTPDDDKDNPDKDNPDKDNPDKDNPDKDNPDRDNTDKDNTNKDDANKDNTNKDNINKDDTNKNDINKDDPNKESENAKDEPVKTGDNSKAWMLMCALILSATIVFAGKVKVKKER